MKLGRLNRTFDERIPKLAKLTFSIPLSGLPESIDYSEGMPGNLGIMLNDKLGNCTCAAYYHAIQVWTHHSHPHMITLPDPNVELMYELACGYDPKQGGEGNGGIEQEVLRYLITYGAPLSGKAITHKLKAFFEIDVHKKDHVKAAIHGCGVLYLGFLVPSYIMLPDGGAKAVWDIEPNSDQTSLGGHAVIAVGYDDVGVKVISWGQRYTMTWAFFQKYTDEAYALIDNDWIDSKKLTPLGMNLIELEEAMAAIKKG
jgi:hypothetical protein